MTTMTTLFRTLAVAAFAATLSACSSTPVAPPPVPKMADLLSQASQAATAGDKEKAVTLWKQTATLYPADKTPWVNITQARYDSGKYSEAIISAQEILVRDPANTFANSIIATSGLRLATRALANLSRQNGFTGSLQKESMELARVLRDSLGHDTLFSPPPEKITIKDPKPPRVKTAETAKVKVAEAAPKIKEKKVDDCKAGDPFCTLK